MAAKKNLRLLLTGGLPDPRAPGLTLRTVAGGFLAQGRDNAVVDDMTLKVVTKRAPTTQELADLKFAFRVAKHVKSNAIVYVRDGATVGIGAGQMSRVNSSRIAAVKAEEAAKALGLSESLAKGSARRLGRLLSFPRRPAGGGGGGRHGGDSARRIGQRQGRDRGGERGRARDGVHRRSAFPALRRRISRRHCVCESSFC